MLIFFFFNDTATTEIYTLSLHDALPISSVSSGSQLPNLLNDFSPAKTSNHATDRKSTRLNSSHGYISYAVFCLKKKKRTDINRLMNSLYKPTYVLASTLISCLTLNIFAL